MKPFVFCPACATKLVDADPSEGGSSCPNCGRTWYRNSAPTAGAAIVRDGLVLLAVRGVEPHKGKFDVPGGFLRPGEEPVSGLKREVKEETGLEIDVSMEDCLQMVPHEYGGEGDYVPRHRLQGTARRGGTLRRVRCGGRSVGKQEGARRSGFRMGTRQTLSKEGPR